MTDTPPAYACSFCAKARREVSTLIAGPRVYICEECVQLCCEILVERRASGKLTTMTDGADTVGKLHAELQVLRESEGKLRNAVSSIARSLEAVTEWKSIHCMWCALALSSEEAAREHVATCEQHPAVIKLREAVLKPMTEEQVRDALAIGASERKQAEKLRRKR